MSVRLLTDKITHQFGVRAENLERILEAYLGPDGVLEKEGIAGLLEKSSDSVSKFGENVWNRVASATRSKRANIKANELSNLDKVTCHCIFILVILGGASQR